MHWFTHKKRCKELAVKYQKAEEERKKRDEEARKQKEKDEEDAKRQEQELKGQCNFAQLLTTLQLMQYLNLVV